MPKKIKPDNYKGNNTKLALSRAMESLLQKHIFDVITVNDLCVCANVARSTFYTHFSNKYHLLLYTLKNMVDHSMSGSENLSTKEILKQFFEFTDSNKTLLSNIFLSNVDYELLDVEKKVFTDACKKYLLKHQNPVYHKDDENNALLLFYVSGVTGVWLQWICGKFVISIDELVDMQCEIIEKLFP